MNSAKMLKSAHWSMGVTFVIALALLYVIYGAELNLSIPVIIFLHIFFVLLAAIFKISYVVRLTALKQLGRPVH